MDPSKYYVLYDGQCGFCNHWVQWILKKDHKDQFRFSPLQSDFAQAFLNERGLNTKELNTIYLWKPTQFYQTKSSAILEIAKQLGGMHGLLARLNFLPRTLRDALYDRVALNRQRLSPQSCLVPTEAQRKKFIE